MSKVSITRSLIDDLAMSISAKSGESVPLTLTEMKDAVDGISDVSVEALSVTQNGTYTAQTGHAYSPVTVNVSGSPSATQHTIYFEFTDSTDETINAWYDDSFISNAITATTPTTYGQKTVETASLDGVEWYHRPTAQWETLLDANNVHVNAGTPYGNMWISELGDVSIAVGSVWRITIDGDAYIMTATANGIYGSPYNAILGNPLYLNGTDDGSDIPLCLEQNPWGAWSGGTSSSITVDVDHALKVERQITA